VFNAPQVRPRGRVEPNGSKAPKWTKYRAVDPHPCDFCKLNQVDDPRAPIARKARYRRVVSDWPDMYLCYEHANDQRIMDGFAKFKRP
jgi:hypothetical protein